MEEWTKGRGEYAETEGREGGGEETSFRHGSKVSPQVQLLMSRY
jgi:hypothetical protein